jgi:Tol biopolymer transport system component
VTWISIVVLFALATVLAVVWAAAGRTPQPPELRMEIGTPPTYDPISLALSPDGRMIVFAASEGGRSGLWLRILAEESARPLNATDNARAPFWSPDSRSVAFFADGQLKVLDIAGRSVRTLVPAGSPFGGTWNREGVIVFAPTSVSPLFRIPSMGGSPVPVTRLQPQHRGHSSPQFLPDGRHFLYYVEGPAETRGTYVGELDTENTKRVVDGDAAVTYGPEQLLFVREGTLFAQQFNQGRLELRGVPAVIAEQTALARRNRARVSTDGGGLIAFRAGGGAAERRYIWFDRAGKELEPVGDPNLGSAPALSPDLRQLAFAREENGNTDVWVLEMARGILNRFTRYPGIDAHPLWSPSGDRIVFERIREGDGDLYLKSVDGTGDEELLLATSHSQIPTDWSRDGAYLLYKESAANGRGGWDIWALPMNGDRKPFAVAQAPAEERDGQFSPDGNWIAYHSDETGEFEVYVQPFRRSGKRERISTTGGAQARWRSDGKELFYVALDGQLMSVPIQLDSTGLTVRAGTPVPLFMTRLDGGVVQTVQRAQYIPSPDGARFLMHTITGDATSSPITVILNWRPDAQLRDPAAQR